ncbi:MAG TPA: TetR/AcrR family transcriptional regulator [Candidatus Dormibacteraeota bacterium]
MAPSARLSRERVLREAVALADREGIEAVTMRRLADGLGAGAMSLYHHVPGKDALLDGMVDRVFAEIEPPSPNGDWKAEMRRRALSTREALHRHPWAVGRMESTKTPGPADLRLHEAVLRCLREAGFSVEMAVQAYSVQDAYIYGYALQERGMGYATQEQFAETASQRVEQMDTAIEELARAYPYLAEVVAGHVAQHGHNLSEAFEFGLDVILDGLERLRGDGV